MKQETMALHALKTGRWSEEEIYKLHLSKHMGASIEMMAKLLSRSKSSVNKALTRLGVRPLGESSRGLKPGERFRRISYATLVARIAHEMTFFVSDKPKIVGKIKKPCLALLTSEVDAPRIDPQLPIMTTLEKVASLWQTQGHDVALIAQDAAPLFRRNTHYFTPSQFLILTNEERVRRNEPVFWIEGVTYL